MVATILVPLDDSEHARSVLAYAAALARPVHGRLVLLQAIADPALERHADDWLGRVAAELAHGAVSLETHVVVGTPAQTILDTARTCKVDAIAMATGRWSNVDRWLNGSVADQILRNSEVPVLLVSPACQQRWPSTGPRRILVPLDGSSLAEEALGPALAVAANVRADVLLVQAIESGDSPGQQEAVAPGTPSSKAHAYLESVAAQEAAQTTRLWTRVISGPPATAIVEAAHAEGIDLIVMATHGRGGLARVLLGSVATQTLLETKVPLLLVRGAVLREAAGQHLSRSATT